MKIQDALDLHLKEEASRIIGQRRACEVESIDEDATDSTTEQSITSREIHRQVKARVVSR